MKFIFIRHGETDDNKNHIIMGGEADKPLNETGIQQAKDVCGELGKLKFDLVVSSPLTRASQTAEIIAEQFNKEIIFDARVKERLYGSWSGKHVSEREQVTGVKTFHDIFMLDYTPWGGESKENIKERLMDFIKDMKAKYSDKNLLVVAHGGVIRSMHNFFGDKELGEHLANVSIHEFDL